MSIEARSLLVPFAVFKPGARVRVWLLPTTEVDEDAPLAVLVDFDSFLRNGLGLEPVDALVDEAALVDRRVWAAETFGVESQGRLVTFPDLSRYGWGLQARGSSKAKASYWTVMFSQTVMRGLCIRLIGCEMDVMAKDAKGEPIDAKKWVKMFRKEVRAYKRIKPLGDFHKWVQREVIVMWRRIAERLTVEENRSSLAFHLKQSNVVVFRQDRKGKNHETPSTEN